MKVAIGYTTQIWREGDQFIAHATPLDVASSGASAQEARHALDEAVHLFLTTAADHGTLEQVLEDCGYVQTGDSWQNPHDPCRDRHLLDPILQPLPRLSCRFATSALMSATVRAA